MPKLHLKRTPEEEALHRLRKNERKEAKRKRRGNHHDTQPKDSSSRKRPRKEEDPSEPERKWASSDEEEQYGPQPAQSASSSTSHSRPGDGRYMNETDDVYFREKLFDAFAEDERLDSLEATFNDFAHIPDRWKSHTSKPKYNIFEEDDWLKVNPEQLDEEDYAEWIRMGMYRKTHADEYAEQQRRKVAEAARHAQAKARREERVRLEKEAEEERLCKKHEREACRWKYAKETYDAKWKAMMDGNENIGFQDIPWPIVRAHKDPAVTSLSVDDLTLEAVTGFLLPTGGAQSRKEVLREAILRFHPDKFEGRLMRRVHIEEQAVVQEGIGRVVRVLNRLMDD